MVNRKVNDIQNIRYYHDVYTLFENELTGNELNAFSADFLLALRNIDDFQPNNYAVIDDKTVIILDSFNGDVFDIVSFDDFITNTIEYVKEWE